ncbi:hypothetical protein ACQ4PT_027039 [Festuca glaucescens]
MEPAASASSSSSPAGPSAERRRAEPEAAELRLRRKTLETVLEQCQRALELMREADDLPGDGPEAGDPDEAGRRGPATSAMGRARPRHRRRTLTTRRTSIFYVVATSDIKTTAQTANWALLCNLLNRGSNRLNFFKSLITFRSRYTKMAQCVIPQMNCYYLLLDPELDETISWDIVSAADIWDDKSMNVSDDSEDGYVLVKQEDIVDGIACFMAAYLLSLKETKELTPNQLQDALSKTFSTKKRKGKLQKAWAGTQVIYNVASWSATAIGIYQNPAILKAATAAFWTSCRVVSKFL